eukprot:jgi/Orpsp1_1/1191490/evm.model.d7180000086292.1
MNNINIDQFVNAIDSKDVNEIKKKIVSFNNKTIDIILEIYNKNCLTHERLKFIVEKCNKFISISSPLIEKLIKANDINLLNIILKNFKFFDNKFILKLLLDYKNKNAVSTKDLNQQIEKYKIKEDIIVKGKNYCSGTLLHRVCENQYENILIVKFLVNHGINIKEEDGDGETALYFACRNGHEATVRYLVEQGADVNNENWFMNSPLFYACENGSETIVRYLVEHGAAVDKENRYGETPLFYGSKDGHKSVVRYLVEHGANKNKKDWFGKLPL